MNELVANMRADWFRQPTVDELVRRNQRLTRAALTLAVAAALGWLFFGAVVWMEVRP